MSNITTIDIITNRRLLQTSDSLSFYYIPDNCSGVPIRGHCGSFGYKRKYHRHEGVDIYLPPNTPIYAVDIGIVTDIVWFTGVNCGHDWWNDTKAVIVDHEKYGIVLYGEILPADSLKVGQVIQPGTIIGYVESVLKVDKGRPISMLHLEQYKDSYSVFEWEDDNMEILVKDPTSLFTSEPETQDILFVCGFWGDESGKRSGWCDQLYKTWLAAGNSINVRMLNGGKFDDLKEVSNNIGQYKRVIWWPNIDNKHEKLLVNFSQHPDLIISKNNRDMSYTAEDYKQRISAVQASSLIEFNKRDGNIRYRIWDKNIHVKVDWVYTDLMPLASYLFGNYNET